MSLHGAGSGCKCHSCAVMAGRKPDPKLKLRFRGGPEMPLPLVCSACGKVDLKWYYGEPPPVCSCVEERARQQRLAMPAAARRAMLQAIADAYEPPECDFCGVSGCNEECDEARAWFTGN